MMTRLQKKCLIATAGTHLLLVVALLCSGFIKSKPKADDVPLLDVIPENVVENAINSGVKNPAKPPPEPVKPPEPQVEQLPQPEPPKPQPPAEKTPEPEPPKLEKTPDPEVKVVVKPPPKPKHTPVVDLTVKVKNSTKPKVKDTTAQDEAREAAREQKRIRDAKLTAIATATSSISKNFSSATDVSMPDDNGPVSFASYASVVKSIYEAKWQAPDDASNDEAVTKVSVTIARDGHVVESHVVNPSGDSKVDASVRRTLERVKFIRAFPDGAKESEKTFIINFNLQAKRSFG